MIKPRIREERFAVIEFVDRNGKTTGIKNATIILCTSNKTHLTLPFTKTNLGGRVKIGDTFVQRTENIPDIEKPNN